MIKDNHGYIGNERSVGSLLAIEMHELPLSKINMTVIKRFLNDNQESYSKAERTVLMLAGLKRWKHVARRWITPASWHHTSGKFNRTCHYYLGDIARHIIRGADEKGRMCRYVVAGINSIQKDTKYARQHVVGVISGDWIYYSGGKVNINGQRIDWYKTFDTFGGLLCVYPWFGKNKVEVSDIASQIRGGVPTGPTKVNKTP